MTFAALVTDMTGVILSEDGLAEPAVLVTAEGEDPVPLTAIIDEPSEADHTDIRQPNLRARRVSLWLPWPAAAGVARGSVVTVTEGGEGGTVRTFAVDQVIGRDPDQVHVAVRETTA